MLVGNVCLLVFEVLEFLVMVGMNYNKMVVSLMNVVIGVLYVFLVYNSMFGFGFVELKMVLLVNDIVILIIFGMV